MDLLNTNDIHEVWNVIAHTMNNLNVQTGVNSSTTWYEIPSIIMMRSLGKSIDRIRKCHFEIDTNPVVSEQTLGNAFTIAAWST